MTNDSLWPGTTAQTRLTELQDGNGNSLSIAATDTMTVSYVMDGKTYISQVQVGTRRISALFTPPASGVVTWP